jgi:hypothetical protein
MYLSQPARETLRKTTGKLLLRLNLDQGLIVVNEFVIQQSCKSEEMIVYSAG